MDYLFYSPESKLYGVTIFVTVVCFQIAFIAWQWFYERRQDYLYYLAYMFSSLCYGFSQFSQYLPFQLLKFLGADFQYYGSNFLPMFSIFLYYRFARSFLSLSEIRPQLNSWVVRLEYFILINAIVASVLILMGVDLKIRNTVFNINTSFIVIASGVIILNFLKGSTPLTRFAMLGTGFLLSGAATTFFMLMAEQKGVELRMDPYLPLLMFVIAEQLTFTTGLTFKTRMLEKEKLLTERALLKEFQKRQLLEKQMYEVRESIARDLHDEIGSGLSKISFLGAMAKKEEQIKSKKIDNIISSAQEMVKSMSEMIWSLNSKNDRLEDTIYFLRRQALEFCEELPIETTVEVPPIIADFEITGIQRRNLLMVLKEALNNAVKHSGCSVITIKFIISNKNLLVSVHDNGNGMFLEAGKSSGNGLKNMDARMKEVNGSFNMASHSGMEIIFELPLISNKSISHQSRTL